MSKITFTTKNQKNVTTNFDYMLQSNTIKAIVSFENPEDFDYSILQDSIPLPEVNDYILNSIIKYCEYYHNNDKSDEENKKWNDEFIKMDDEILFELILAANYLDINSLLELTCQTVANYIKSCKTPKEIRRRFNITNDFTPEEEEEIRSENAWCEDK